MSEITNQQPSMADIRKEFAANFAKNAADEKARETAEAAEPQEAALEVEPAEAAAASGEEELLDEMEPEAEPETPQQAQPAPAKRGRKSAEGLIRNVQSLQDKRFNEVMSVVQQQSSEIQQLKAMIAERQTAANPAPTEEEESPYDPEFMKLIEKKALSSDDRQALSELKLRRQVEKYQYENPDHAYYDPIVTEYVKVLPKSVPITKELLTDVKNVTAKVLWLLGNAIENNAGQPASVGAVANSKPSQGGVPQNGRQLDPNRAAALKAEAGSMRTEAGSNAGSNLRETFKADRAGIMAAALAAVRNSGGK